MYDLTLKNECGGCVISIPKCALYTIKAPDNIFHSVRSNWATAETNCRDSNCLPQGLASRLPPSLPPSPPSPLQTWQVKCSARFSRASGVFFFFFPLRSTSKLSCSWNETCCNWTLIHSCWVSICLISMLPNSITRLLAQPQHLKYHMFFKQKCSLWCKFAPMLRFEWKHWAVECCRRHV